MGCGGGKCVSVVPASAGSQGNIHLKRNYAPAIRPHYTPPAKKQNRADANASQSDLGLNKSLKQ